MTYPKNAPRPANRPRQLSKRRGRKPGYHQRIKKLEADHQALSEAYDLLNAEVEVLRLRVARYLAEADLNMLAEM